MKHTSPPISDWKQKHFYLLCMLWLYSGFSVDSDSKEFTCSLPAGDPG